MRPPNVIVATAVQRCTRGDWEEPDHLWADHLTWLSVYNKMDYARLHGTTLHMNAIWVRHTSCTIAVYEACLWRNIAPDMAVDAPADGLRTAAQQNLSYQRMEGRTSALSVLGMKASEPDNGSSAAHRHVQPYMASSSAAYCGIPCARLKPSQHMSSASAGFPEGAVCGGDNSLLNAEAETSMHEDCSLKSLHCCT